MVGIDPGKKGAMVALNGNGKPISWLVADEKPNGYCIGDYSPARIAAWLRGLREVPQIVAVERQFSKPPEGRTSALTTGFGWGLLVGVVATLGLPQTKVGAKEWQKGLRLPSKKITRTRRKQLIIQRIEQRIPSLPLVLAGRRVPSDGLADAAGIALWALSTLATE